MPKITFHYNLEKDVQNYLDSVFKFDKMLHGRKNLPKEVARFLFEEDLKKIKTAKNRATAKRVVTKILQNYLAQNKDVINKNILVLEKIWAKRENRFIKELEKFYKKPYILKKIKCFFTTLPICPYHYTEHWFMVSLKDSLEGQIQTICHELFHFMFWVHYGMYCRDKNLPVEKFEMLKEALTVFLNIDDFRKINTIPDKGYPQEAELRKFLLREYKKDKNFQKLLDKAINYLNKK